MAAKGLGKGLGALIKETVPAAPAGEAGGITMVPTNRVRKSRWQPRQRFSPDALEDLVRSVRERGVLQPLLVRQAPSKDNESTYELIAGERRLRAAQEAQVREVPAILMDVSDSEALELALVENLQREDLNVVEEAEGYQALAEHFHLTQEQIAERVGKARTTIANCLRLLSLPDPVKQLIAENRLSPGHAKVILGLPVPEEQVLLAEQVVKEDLSVRSLERLVSKRTEPARKARPRKEEVPAHHLRHLADRLQQHFGTSVRITPCGTSANGKKIKGSIELDYYSSEELDRLIEMLGLSETL